MPTNTPRPTKAQRTEAAQAALAAARATSRRRARRARFIGGSVVAVAVAALVSAGVFVMHEANTAKADNAAVTYANDVPGALAPSWDQVTAPSVADDTGGIAVSDDAMGSIGDGDVVVDIYLDLACTFCKQFEARNHATLNELISAGGVSVVYHLISFLDEQSAGTKYSTRAANALAVVADADPNHFDAFMSALYTHQPDEGGKGLTDTRIAELARAAGVPASVTDRFTATVAGTFHVDGTEKARTGRWRTFAPWVAAATAQAASDLPKLSTPTILIDGQPFTDWTSDGALTAAVVNAFAR